MVDNINRLQKTIKQVRLVREENANRAVSKDLQKALVSLQNAVDSLEEEENLDLPR